MKTSVRYILAVVLLGAAASLFSSGISNNGLIETGGQLLFLASFVLFIDSLGFFFRQAWTRLAWLVTLAVAVIGGLYLVVHPLEQGYYVLNSQTGYLYLAIGIFPVVVALVIWKYLPGLLDMPAETSNRAH